ncbi:MAG TPA: hypothetical protein VGE77_07170 [Nocardioides sp.]
MPRRTALLPVALPVALPAALLLAGCASVDEDAVAAIADLPAVTSAQTSCDVGECRVAVTVEGDVTADRLAAIVAAGRGAEGDEVRVRRDLRSPGGATWQLVVHTDSPADDDPALAAAVLDLAGVPGTTAVWMVREPSGTDVEVTVDGARDVAELRADVDPLVAGLPDVAVDVVAAADADRE